MNTALRYGQAGEEIIDDVEREFEMPDADATMKRKGMEREQYIFQHSDTNKLAESGRMQYEQALKMYFEGMRHCNKHRGELSWSVHDTGPWTGVQQKHQALTDHAVVDGIRAADRVRLRVLHPMVDRAPPYPRLPLQKAGDCLPGQPVSHARAEWARELPSQQAHHRAELLHQGAHR